MWNTGGIAEDQFPEKKQKEKKDSSGNETHWETDKGNWKQESCAEHQGNPMAISAI